MFASWSVALRLYAGFGLVVLALAVTAVMAILSASSVGRTFQDYRGVAVGEAALASAQESILIARLATETRGYINDPEAVTRELDKALAVVGPLRESAELATQEVANQVIAGVNAYRTAYDAYAATQIAASAAAAAMQATAIAERRAIGEFHRDAVAAGQPELAMPALAASEQMLVARARIDRYLAGAALEEFASASAPLQAARDHVQTASDIGGAFRPRIVALAEGLESYARAAEQARETEERRRSASETLTRITPQMTDPVRTALHTRSQQRNMLGTVGMAAIASTQFLLTVMAVVAVLAGMGLAWLIARWIGGDIRRMAGDMTRVAQGDLAVEVTGVEFAHELGAMARALQAFKDNALKVQGLDAERARARADMMAELQEAFGVVVDAAAAGDFSKRVTARFADAELNTLAEGLNRLVETVETGLAETGRVMGRIAAGDLTERMRGVFAGAFATLQRDVNATVERLGEVVAEIAGVSGDIASATEEIASSARQVSSRAEQQAAALEETSATMEQMASSIASSADNAQRAAGLAHDTEGRAGEGRKLADASEVAMKRIAEGSSRIADITALIDSIAFQTNLLALNASVEAARAGDAGRGFAVVASEVRTLAQRSAEAAREIKGVIDTSAAQVGEGVEQVARTRAALEGIAEAVQNVTAAIGEISQAAREQSSGVGEITSAVQQMDQMTQSNAAVAEESASNASGLAEQAQRLRALVGGFTVETSRRYAVAAE